MMSELMGAVNAGEKFFSFFRYLFKKNNKVIFLHSNVKQMSEEDYDGVVKRLNYSKYNVQSKKKKINASKWFLFRTKLALYKIYRDNSKIVNFTYGGFVSVPLSIYDGYVVGDNHNCTFICVNRDNNEVYKVEYKKNKINSDLFKMNFPKQCTEVALIINSSFKISENNIRYPIIKLDFLCDKQINNEYLNKMYSYVFDILSKCKDMGILKVHLYCSSLQPISFIIGTAIQTYHPQVIVYEFFNGEYTWGFDIKKGQYVKGKIKNGNIKTIA